MIYTYTHTVSGHMLHRIARGMQPKKGRDTWSRWWGDWNFPSRKVTWFSLSLARTPGARDSSSWIPRAMSLEKERDQGLLPVELRSSVALLRRARQRTSVTKSHGHAETGHEAGCVSAGSRSKQEKQLTPAFGAQQSFHLLSSSPVTRDSPPVEKGEWIPLQEAGINSHRVLKRVPIRAFRVSALSGILRSSEVHAILFFLC